MGKLIVSVVVTALGLATAVIAVADRTFSIEDIKGSYAFSWQGEVLGVGPAAAAGVFHADGEGNIDHAFRTISLNDLLFRQTFTCTLSVNPNGMGSADCLLSGPAPGYILEETFEFVLEDKAKGFRFVGTTPGHVVLGSGRRQ